MTGSRSVAVLCEAVRSLDDERDATSLASVRTDGLTIVELADRYDAVYTLDERVVEKFVGDMGGFDEIIVDAPQPFAAAARPFVSRATRFFVVLEPTLLGVAGAQSMLADLKRFGVPATRIDLISNARTEPALVQRAEIERALESKLVAEIPLSSSRNYPKAISTLQRYLEALPIGEPLQNLQPSAGGRSLGGSSRQSNGRATTSPTAGDPKRDAFKQEVHAALVRQLDLVTASEAHGDAAKLAELRSKVEGIAASLVATSKFTGTAEELADLRREIVDEALGLGPLEDLLRDPDITEIMVNGPATIYVERGRQDRADDQTLQQRPAAAPDYRTNHHAARAASRRIVADGRRPPSGRIARQRDHRSDCNRWNGDDDSPFRTAPPHRRRPAQDWSGSAADARLSARRSSGSP